MIYPVNFEQKVGFDRLREQVAALCSMRTARAKLQAEELTPSHKEVERRLSLVDEMRALLELERDFPNDEYVDVDHIASKIDVLGTFLLVEEVVTLRRALAAVGAVTRFVRSRTDGAYPALRRHCEGVEAFPDIIARIDAIVDNLGKIKDNASPEL